MQTLLLVSAVLLTASIMLAERRLVRSFIRHQQLAAIKPAVGAFFSQPPVQPPAVDGSSSPESGTPDPDSGEVPPRVHIELGGPSQRPRTAA